MSFSKSFLILTLIFTLNINSVTDNQAKICTKLITAGVASTFAGWMYNTAKENNCSFDKIELALFATYVSLAAASTYFVSNNIFSYFNSKSYLKSAKDKISNASGLDLLNNENYDKKNLIENIEKIYINHKYPLVVAFNNLTLINTESKKIIDFLNKSKSQDSSNKLTKETENLLKIFDDSFFERLNEALEIIKKHPDLIDQMQLRVYEASSNIPIFVNFGDNDFLFLYLLLLLPIYLEKPEYHLDNWYKACSIGIPCFAIALIINSYYKVKKNMAEIDLIKAKIQFDESEVDNIIT